MSEVAEFWSDVNKERRRKKELHRHGGGMERSIEEAKSISNEFKQISFEHYRMTIKTDRGLRVFDFWPSTLRWREFKKTACGNGLDKIRRYLKLEQ